MPITATAASTQSTTTCNQSAPPPQNPPVVLPQDLCCPSNIVTPNQATFLGNVVYPRMKTIRVTYKQKAIIHWTMLTPEGLPLSLASCFPELVEGSESSTSSSSSISMSSSMSVGEVSWVIGTPVLSDCGPLELRFKVREQLSNSSEVAEVTPEIIDVTAGLVSVELPTTVVPGIYFAEVGLYDETGEEPVLHYGNLFYLAVEPGVSLQQLSGPPSLAEVRLSLRDSSPAESRLLDEIRFDTSEIVLAIRRPVEYWNEQPPPIGTFNTTNFPFRYNWLNAIAGYLFLTVAEQFRANNLQYSAGGVSLNDQNKEMPYEQAARRYLDDWRLFVRNKKASINLENAYGGIGSTYGRMG